MAGRADKAHGDLVAVDEDVGDLGPIIEFHISTFDDPDALVPSVHSDYSERIHWFDVADDLPRYERFWKNSPLLCHGPASPGSSSD